MTPIFELGAFPCPHHLMPAWESRHPPMIASPGHARVQVQGQAEESVSDCSWLG